MGRKWWWLYNDPFSHLNAISHWCNDLIVAKYDDVGCCLSLPFTMHPISHWKLYAQVLRCLPRRVFTLKAFIWHLHFSCYEKMDIIKEKIMFSFHKNHPLELKNELNKMNVYETFWEENQRSFLLYLDTVGLDWNNNLERVFRGRD